MARGAWWAAVPGATRSRTWLTERSTQRHSFSPKEQASGKGRGESRWGTGTLRAVRLPWAALWAWTRALVRVSEPAEVQPREGALT